MNTTTTTHPKIESVPFIFRNWDHSLYPADNFPDFEYWLYEGMADSDIIGDRVYLPITFTNFYKNVCNYGNNKDGIKILQDFLNTLDTSKKYFCVCQYDDGILNDISHLDIKVFSMAGGRKDYGLPLICQQHRIKFNNPRDIFCSFVGRITNPVRQKIIDIYSGKTGYFVSTHAHSLPDYCRILSKSVFGLCPAGYGSNSFRIQECLEYGAIPVWITSDVLPIHDLKFNDFGVFIDLNDVERVDQILKEIPQDEIEYKQSLLPDIFESYFSFSANKSHILANL